MPTDTFYGAECEARIGAMADPDTDPTTWYALEFVSLSVTPTRERRERPKMGRARHNVLDPLKPIPGFFRLGAELVVEADSRHLPRLLRLLLGAPSTTGPSAELYTHVWASGGKALQYAALQIRTASGEVRVFRGLTLGSLSAQAGGEQTRDFDISLSLRGLGRAREDDFLGDAPTALPAESPALRAEYLVDGVAAASMLSASFVYDRQLAEDAFLSPTPELSGLRPNGGVHSGQATIRAVGAVFDDMEEADTVFAAALRLNGVVAGHEIRLEHPQAMLSAPALSINGPALIERSIAWTGHQTASVPATRITVKNDVASYA